MYILKLPGPEAEADIVAKEETYDQCEEEPSAPAPPVHKYHLKILAKDEWIMGRYRPELR